MKTTHNFTKTFLLVLAAFGFSSSARSEEMDEMWGESVVKLRADNSERGQLFDQGNCAIFVHWGVYSHLAGKYKGKTASFDDCFTKKCRVQVEEITTNMDRSKSSGSTRPAGCQRNRWRHSWLWSAKTSKRPPATTSHFPSVG